MAKTSKSKKSDSKSDSKKPATKAAPEYDESKDEVIKNLGTMETGSSNGDILVRVVSYNGGEPRLSVTRTGLRKKDGPGGKAGSRWYSPKLGRLTGKELAWLLPKMTKAQKYVPDNSAED